MQRFAWSPSTDDKEVSNSLFKVLSLSKCILLLWLYTHLYTFAGKQHSTSLINYRYNKQCMTTVMETIWFHLTLGYRPIVVFAKWLERLKCISLCPCKCVARTAFSLYNDSFKMFLSKLGETFLLHWEILHMPYLRNTWSHVHVTLLYSKLHARLYIMPFKHVIKNVLKHKYLE